jgi:hypothetical protein
MTGRSMTIIELKNLAKKIDPRLALAYYGDTYIEVRLYRPHSWQWSRLSVIHSLHDVHMYLVGMAAARRLA